MPITIITDSSCDLPEEILRSYDIQIVPLYIYFGETEYIDRISLTTESFYQFMREAEELPKTASPAPQTFLDQYRKAEPGSDILVITLSKELSSTYQSAGIAAEQWLQENPGRRIEVVNSKTASAGLGNLVVRLAELRAQGATMDGLIEFAQPEVEKMKTIFVLDTLENAIKNGRVDRLKGKLAGLLNIKLIMQRDEIGKIEVLEKIRGSKKALSRLADLVEELTVETKEQLLAITHSNCLDRAYEVKEMLEARYQNRIRTMISDMGPTIGTHAGEGGIVISFS